MSREDRRLNKRRCSLPGCDRPHNARGLCQSCYKNYPELRGEKMVRTREPVPEKEVEPPCIEPGCEDPRRAGTPRCGPHLAERIAAFADLRNQKRSDALDNALRELTVSQ